LSVGLLIDEGKVVAFTNSHYMVWDDIKGSEVLAMGTKQKSNGLYKLKSEPQVSIAKTEDKARLWHKRYGHLHYRGLTHLFKNGTV
jgi:hypothetical protein